LAKNHTYFPNKGRRSKSEGRLEIHRKSESSSQASSSSRLIAVLQPVQAKATPQFQHNNPEYNSQGSLHPSTPHTSKKFYYNG